MNKAYRRFIPIGDDATMATLDTLCHFNKIGRNDLIFMLYFLELCERKNLDFIDLALIKGAIRLNPSYDPRPELLSAIEDGDI